MGSPEAGSVVERLRERLAEYQAALADLDFDTGAGWFRLDVARDELIGMLGLDPNGDDPLIVPALLGVVEALESINQLASGAYAGGLSDFMERVRIRSQTALRTIRAPDSFTISEDGEYELRYEARLDRDSDE